MPDMNPLAGHDCVGAGCGWRDQALHSALIEEVSKKATTEHYDGIIGDQCGYYRGQTSWCLRPRANHSSYCSLHAHWWQRRMERRIATLCRQHKEQQ